MHEGGRFVGVDRVPLSPRGARPPRLATSQAKLLEFVESAVSRRLGYSLHFTKELRFAGGTGQQAGQERGARMDERIEESGRLGVHLVFNYE